MFEKEAEEWANEMYPCDGQAQRYLIEGAEFGYNKANEWHYVKDRDLPKENIYLVIRLNDENTCYKCCTGFWEKEERCFHTLFCNKVDTKDIIAWKEIVLPKGE